METVAVRGKKKYIKKRRQGRGAVRDVMGHVTGLFCLLQLALTKTEAEEGSDDIKPARSSSLCVGVSPRSC